MDFKEDIRLKAIHEITHYNGPDITAIQRLELARIFQVGDFVGPAFKILCSRTHPLSSLSANDIQRMGLPIFEVLAKVKESTLR